MSSGFEQAEQAERAEQVERTAGQDVVGAHMRTQPLEYLTSRQLDEFTDLLPDSFNPDADANAIPFDEFLVAVRVGNAYFDLRQRAPAPVRVGPNSVCYDTPVPQVQSSRAIVAVEPILAEPFKGQRMARREHQMPNVHRQEGPRPYWYTRYRKKVLVGKGQISKKEAWHRLGYCDEITKRQALRLRDEILRDVNREVYTIQSHIRLADFVEIYQAQHIPTLAASVQAKYRSLLDVHLIPAFGAMKLCEIDTELLQRFLNTKEKEGLAWWTRSDLKNLLSGIFTKAADWGYWKERNPTSRVELGRKRPKRQRRILTDEELRSLLASLPDDVRLMVETAVSTGMRVSEIIGLKWQCVDFGLGCVRVTQRYYRGDTDAPKTEKSRRDLPLGHLANVYRQRKPDGASGDDYVFEIGGEPMDDRAVLKNVIRPTARRLGIYFEGFGWHSFRRQNLTVMQEVGATPFEAQAQAGHSRPAMTSEYTMVNLDRRAQSVLRLQERLFGVSRSALVN